jgi:hypothetical protein
MNGSRRLMASALGVTVAGLAACASSGFVSSWRAPDATPLQVSGAKVAAVVMMTDEASRRAAEDALVRELTARGADGVPMYSIMPDARPENEEAARAAAEQAGVAGVVVMRPVGTQRELVSSPTTFRGPAYSGFWRGYYGFGWRSAWGVGISSSDIRTNTIVSVETLVYSLRQNKLVWGGVSRTTNPSDVNRLVRDTANKVGRELERQGLITS